MGALDGLLAPVAAIMQTFGTNATLRTVVTGSYDPASGTTAGASTSDSTVKVRLSQYRKDEVDGDAVQAGDIMAFYAADGNPTPAQDDILIVGSQQYEVVNVERTYATDSVVLWKLQVRR